MRVRTKDDGLGPMRDGDVLRVRMSMMDSLDAIQREVASDLVTDRPRVRAADGSVLGLHRPGARLATGVDPLVLSGNARDRAEFRENGRYARPPDGRGRYPTANVPGDIAADRGTTAATTTSAGVRRPMVMRSSQPGCIQIPGKKARSALDQRAGCQGCRRRSASRDCPAGRPEKREYSCQFDHLGNLG